MSDICVAYWSGTGNTEAMAQAIGAGITAAGKSADVVPMETISPADLKDQTVWDRRRRRTYLPRNTGSRCNR